MIGRSWLTYITAWGVSQAEKAESNKNKAAKVYATRAFACGFRRSRVPLTWLWKLPFISDAFMVIREEARRLISAWLTTQSARANIALDLLDQHTIETEFGWVFFYTSRQFKQSGGFRDAFAGNAAVIVDRAVGSLHVTGTARPTAEYIEDFRRTRAMVGLRDGFVCRAAPR